MRLVPKLAQTASVTIAALVLPATSFARVPLGAEHDPAFAPVVLIDLIPGNNERPVASRVFTFTTAED